VDTFACLVKARQNSICPLIIGWWVIFVSKRARLAVARRLGRVERTADPSGFAIGRAAKEARATLYAMNPSFSAKHPAGRVMVAVMLIFTIAAVSGALGIEGLAGVWGVSIWLFAALGLLRAMACLVPQTKETLPVSPDHMDVVPVWSILIALYDEADSVPSLLTALSKLDWSHDQLDIIFACERDDAATLQALSKLQNTYAFRIVRVPAGGPRTKPNALQTALPFARGRFVTIYDAEDRPDPAQLRAAFQAFINGPANLAVVQAPLVAWNHTESWIARQFALDYAVWFRVLLPALARISHVLPLGGTSNHFRIDALRQSGGWDPYNVTEDADLGIRLGRLGYRSALISPPTHEEAPPRIGAWIKQRGRWIQGHIQSFSVHTRQPVSLAKALTWRGLFGFVVGIGIGPLSAAMVLPMVVSIIVPTVLAHQHPLTLEALVWMGVGLSGHMLTCAFGAYRDGRLSLLRACLTLPLYHCLQTLAASRAFWRVVFTPSVWDKTDHGGAARERTRAVK
jgi:glycosyltransferase XagB